MGWFEGMLWAFANVLRWIGNAFANITSVELDFSIMKWEKDDFWQSMMNLTLEGISQAKQRRVVMGILVSTGFDDGVGPNRTNN